MAEQVKINSKMVEHFLLGLNAIADNGKSISADLAHEIVESKKLVSYLIEEGYTDYWDFTAHDKYENHLCELLFDYEMYIKEDSFRKYGIKNDGFLILSRLCATVLNHNM